MLAVDGLEDLVFTIDLFLDGLGQGGLDLQQVLLELDALGDDVALHGLLLEAAELLKPLGDGLLFLFLQESLTSLSDGIHKLGLEQVVEGVKLEALVEQLNVDLAGQAHQPHGLVLDLGYEGAVVLALRGDEFGDKVLAIGLGDCLTLAVKYVGQVVVVLLLRVPHLDVGEDEDSRGEVRM